MTSQQQQFVFHPTKSLADSQSETFVQASGFYNITPEIKVMENTPAPSFVGDLLGNGYDSFSNAAFDLFSHGSTDDVLLTTPMPPTLSYSEQCIEPSIMSRNSSTSPSSVYHTPLGDSLSSFDVAQLFSNQVVTQGNQTRVTPQDLLPIHPRDMMALQTSPASTSMEGSSSFYVSPAALHLSNPVPTSRVASPAPSFHTASAALSRPGSAYSVRSAQSFHSQRPSLQLATPYASHSITAPTLVSPTPQRINPASAPFVFPPQSDANLSSSMGPCAGTIDPSVIVSPRIAKHTRFGSAPSSASYSPMHSAKLSIGDSFSSIYDHMSLSRPSPATAPATAFTQATMVGDALSAACRSVSPAARSPYHHSELDESGSSAYSPFTPFAHTRNTSIVSASAHTNYFSTSFNSVEASAPFQHVLGLGGVDPTLLSAHTACATSSPSTRHPSPWSEAPQYPVDATSTDAYGSCWMAVPAPAAPKTTSKRKAPRKNKQPLFETQSVGAEATDDEYVNNREDTDDEYEGEDKKRKRGKNSAAGANKRQRMAASDEPSASYDSDYAQVPKAMKRKYTSLPRPTKDMRKCPVCPFVPSNKRFSDVLRHWQSHLKEGASDKIIYVCTLCGDVERDPVTMELVYNNKPGHPKSVTTVYTRKDSVKRHWNNYHKSTDPIWQEEYIAIVDAVHPDAAGAKKRSSKQEEEVDRESEEMLAADNSVVSLLLSA